MEAEEALQQSPEHCAKFIGNGYCLVISQRGPTALIAIDLDEDRLCREWGRSYIPDLKVLNAWACLRYPGFSPQDWQPVSSWQKEIQLYNRWPDPERSKREKPCASADVVAKRKNTSTTEQ